MPATGSCLCGAVSFEVDGALRAVINCHCGQCRKWSGHFVAATCAWKRDFQINDPGKALAWFRSSALAQRGFCRRCGSSLFWRLDDADTISIMAGALDGDTGLGTGAQIYVEYKGDYYDLGEPQAPTFARSGHGIALDSGEGSS